MYNVLGIALESGASVLLVAPSPVANSCSLDSPPGIGDVPVQAPGPGRFKHWALAGAQGALRLALVQCRDGTHEINTQSNLCGMLCTYVHLRIDIDLSNPLPRDERNINANSMQQILHSSSEIKMS